ncbi:hypothetical protein ANN_14840 [Periplaneta americana]|uniref:Reverse transcriptase domain-containing protein n=1 Tax=Periplaneta americana TaxID=6978 RepID=A0ABQ8SYT6_PERAM|nr:hypothetical protein ANN_14840 [Periplaneta americana]
MSGKLLIHFRTPTILSTSTTNVRFAVHWKHTGKKEETQATPMERTYFNTIPTGTPNRANCVVSHNDAMSHSAARICIRKVQDNRQGLELKGSHQLLVYKDDVNMLGENPQKIRENMEILLEASKAISLEVNPEKTKSLPSKETLREHSDSSFRGEGYIQCCVGVRLCDMYSNQELAEIHFMYGKADANAALARRLYQERHDGAPAHFSRTARRYLNRRFPDRWIGRGGPIAWLPRSPDLNPLDFYLWGHLKSLVYSSPVPDLESLRNRIVACSEDIRNTPGVWDRVRRSMRHRCEVCIQAGGGHFEHLL